MQQMLDPEQLEELFAELLARPPDERAGWLESACAGDAALRERLDKLLAAHLAAGNCLPLPALVPESPVESAGLKIGRYQLLEQIGEGGFGVVFMAEQTSPVRRRVALKIIKLGMDTKQVVARFEAERQALAMMDHENIARVFDGGATDTGRPYFVMELVRGVPITTYCDENKLSTRERLKLFMTVCSAVQHAHQKGIIHRDLKPSNVLVTMHDDKPVPKVIDFGVAKATQSRLTDRTLFTEFRQMIGTPAYMSPEQAQMSGLDVDTRSDIYSLGVLLYELLTGTTPFDTKQLQAAALAEIHRLICETEPPRPSTRLSSLATDRQLTAAGQRGTDPRRLTQTVRGDLDWIVMKCLEKDRKRRYETANALCRDVERYLADEAVHARPPTRTYRLRKFARKYRVGLMVASGFLLLLIISTAVSTHQAVRIRAEQHNALAQRRKALTEAAKSAQVAAFMKQMLRGVGPSVALGRDATMLREILDETARHLDELAPVPEVDAEIRATLGRVYCDLGLYEQALSMHRQALALRRRSPNQDERLVAESINDLAQVAHQQGRFNEAESLNREALNIRRSIPGDASPEVAESEHNLAETLRRQNQWPEAENLHRQALATRRQLFGNQHVLVADSLQHLGVLLSDTQKGREAEVLLREALTIRRNHLSEKDPAIARTLENLGVTLIQLKRFADAESALREALEIRKALLETAHPDIARSMHALAFALRGQGKLSEAQTLYQESIRMQRLLFGGDHADLRDSLAHLAETQRLAGRLDESEATFRQALAVKAEPQVSQPSMAFLQIAFAQLLETKGNLAEAEALLRDAVRVRRQLLGNDSRVADVAERLVSVLMKRKKFEDAESLARECIAIRSTAPTEVPALARVRAALGDCLVQLKKFDEAELAFFAALEVFERQAAVQEHRRCIESLIALYESWGKTDRVSIWRQRLSLAATSRQSTTAPGSQSSFQDRNLEIIAAPNSH